MTWEYRGLQGVAEGYKGLQAVKRGYRGLQGITKGDGGVQGVTGAYRGLQRIIKFFFITKRSQMLFLGLFCMNIKVEEISNF